MPDILQPPLFKCKSGSAYLLCVCVHVCVSECAQIGQLSGQLVIQPGSSRNHISQGNIKSYLLFLGGEKNNEGEKNVLFFHKKIVTIVLYHAHLVNEINIFFLFLLMVLEKSLMQMSFMRKMCYYRVMLTLSICYFCTIYI